MEHRTLKDPSYKPNSSDTTKTRGGWFKVPNDLVVGGWLAVLSPADLHVLLYFRKLSDRNGHAWPTAKVIVSDLGLSRRQALRSIARLTELGWLADVDCGPGKRQPVRENLNPGKVPDSWHLSGGRKVPTRRIKRCQPGARKGANQAHALNKEDSDPLHTHQHQHGSAGAADGDEGGGEEGEAGEESNTRHHARLALIEAGILDRKTQDSLLDANPGLTNTIIEEQLRAMGRRVDNPAGLLITKLKDPAAVRHLIEQEQADQRRLAEYETKLQAEREQEEQRRKAESRRAEFVQEGARLILYASDDDVLRHRDTLIARSPSLEYAYLGRPVAQLRKEKYILESFGREALGEPDPPPAPPPPPPASKNYGIPVLNKVVVFQS